MTTNDRARRHVVANRECMAVLGGQASVASIWRSSPDAFVDLADSESYEVAEGDECLVLFDLRLDMPRSLEWQKRLVAAGATVVFVGVEPGAVQLGPVVLPGKGRCLHCLQHWIRINHATGKAFAVEHGRPRPSPYRPLSPASRNAVASEQSDGIGQVNVAVTQLDQMTQQNAALVEEGAAAAESLREQASRLSEVVSTFRLHT